MRGRDSSPRRFCPGGSFSDGLLAAGGAVGAGIAGKQHVVRESGSRRPAALAVGDYAKLLGSRFQGFTSLRKSKAQRAGTWSYAGRLVRRDIQQTSRCLPPFHRRPSLTDEAGLLTRASTPLTTFPGLVPSGLPVAAPRLQWRARAGFSPASRFSPKGAPRGLTTEMLALGGLPVQGGLVGGLFRRGGASAGITRTKSNLI